METTTKRQNRITRFLIVSQDGSLRRIVQKAKGLALEAPRPRRSGDPRSAPTAPGLSSFAGACDVTSQREACCSPSLHIRDLDHEPDVSPTLTSLLLFQCGQTPHGNAPTPALENGVVHSPAALSSWEQSQPIPIPRDRGDYQGTRVRRRSQRESGPPVPHRLPPAT